MNGSATYFLFLHVPVVDIIQRVLKVSESCRLFRDCIVLRIEIEGFALHTLDKLCDRAKTSHLPLEVCFETSE